MKYLILLIINLLISAHFVFLRAGAPDAEFSYHISDHDVRCFAQDRLGNMWIGTAKGLNRYNGANYLIYYADGADGGLNDDNISSMVADSRGRIWLCNDFGLSCLENGRFTHSGEPVYNKTSKIIDYDENHIVVVGKDGLIKLSKSDFSLVDRYHTVGTSWIENVIATAALEIWFTKIVDGVTYVCALDGDLGLKFCNPLGRGVSVNGMCEDAEHNVWLATDSGLLRFDSRSGASLPVPDKLSGISGSGKIHFVLAFRDHSILMGIKGVGLRDYNLVSGFSSRIAKQEQLEGDGYVCYVDKDDIIWLGGDEDGFSFYLPYWNYSQLDPVSGNDHIRQLDNLVFGGDGHLWMRADESIFAMDAFRDSVVWHSPAGAKCRALTVDTRGRLWAIVDGNKIIRYHTGRGGAVEERRFTLDDEAFSISENRDGAMIISSVRRLYVIGQDDSVLEIRPGRELPFSVALSDPRTHRVFLLTLSRGLYEIDPDFSFRPVNDGLFRGVSSVMLASDGGLWLGLANEGLVRLDEKTGQIERFGVADGLIDRSVKSILEDSEGNIWFSSNRHVSKLDTRTGEISVIYDNRFGEGKSYCLGSAVSGPDGRLYFGGSGGITVVDPKVDMPAEDEIPLYLESVSVNGEKREDCGSLMGLSHLENTLEFRFGAVDFVSGPFLKYSYMLEGYDRDWNVGDNVVDVRYSLVPPGKYTFRVKMRNHNGVWARNELSVPVVIRPSPWASPAAFVVYGLFFVIGVVAAVRIYVQWRTQKERIAIAEEREKMNSENIEFLANISHEFRTPLSMIFAPVRELSRRLPDAGPREKMYIRTIERNAERLKVLSEHFFDVMEGASRRHSLSVSDGDLGILVGALVDNFRFSALEKGLELECVKSGDACEDCVFDKEIVTKIITNLLSNAVKYSDPGGAITVGLTVEGDRARISVKDTGVGVAPEMVGRLFERFDRLDAEKRAPEAKGLGIGLNYASKLAAEHKGELRYEPNEPRGSVFILEIPVGTECYSGDELAVRGVEQSVSSSVEPVLSADNPLDKSTVLVAEDNQDVRAFLQGLLSEHYNVILATNGIEAEDMLRITLPDIVLSDVVMPGKTGDQLCEEIKAHQEWAHIPVILLTAKSDHQSRLSGIKKGADAYVDKPFDPEQLLAMIQTMIDNRKLIQSKVMDMVGGEIDGASGLDALQLSDSELDFLRKVTDVMSANIDNENFGITELASALCVSYSSLYSKIKALTGTTPQLYVTTFRMNTALSLLKTGNYSVGEVADRVGSSSPYTFSREFKKHFGFPPSKARSNG